jgi:hypothetical protein
VRIESSTIALSNSAWIEKSTEFVGMPENFSPNMLAFTGINDDPNYGLTRFYKELLESDVQIRVTFSGEEFEKNPFQLHDCAHIAIAIAILCDPWFVVGIEKFENNRSPDSPSLGPWTTFFIGENSQEPATIARNDEIQLKQIYAFVYQALAHSSWEDQMTKLLLLFLRCVVRGPYQRFPVLNIGLDHLFTEWHNSILNAALFFESLFTNESNNIRQGVQIWNRLYKSAAAVDEELIDIIFQHRHLVSHPNPTRAIHKISHWKNGLGLNDIHVTDVIRKGIWRSAKTCMRAIINNPNQFHEFQKTRPD